VEGTNSVAKNRSLIPLVSLILILFISTLACSQSGRIITSAEATEMARPTERPTTSAAEGLQPGTVVYLTNKSFLVSIMSEPGGNRMIAGQERGAEVKILQSTTVEDGTIWYLIEAPTGQGWVPEDNITTEAP